MVLTRASFGHVTLQEPPRNKFILTRELSRLRDLSNVRGMLFIKTPRRPSCQSGGSACVPFFERNEGRSRGISRTSEYYRSSKRGKCGWRRSQWKSSSFAAGFGRTRGKLPTWLLIWITAGSKQRLDNSNMARMSRGRDWRSYPSPSIKNRTILS